MQKAFSILGFEKGSEEYVTKASGGISGKKNPIPDAGIPPLLQEHTPISFQKADEITNGIINLSLFHFYSLLINPQIRR